MNGTTSEKTTLKIEHEHNENGNLPFLLAPAYKDYLWGGRKLIDEYGKYTDMSPIAESWECSVHVDGESSIASGKYKSRKLSQVLAEHPEFVGSHPEKAECPILIKLIDARKDLSIQVHPDDNYAAANEHGARGKTEMWYVLHAEQGARLVYGFKRDVTKQEVQKALKNGSVEKLLQYIPVKSNDVFMVAPGTVHAIGGGIVIAEIQVSSNLTYRIYDYDRIDKNGNKRELHISSALSVLNYKGSNNLRQPTRVLNYRNGYALELLARCRYFVVERMLLNTERYRKMADFRTGNNSFKVLMCVDGCGTMFSGINSEENTGKREVMINFFKGDSIFVPANSVNLKLHGRAQMLVVGC